MSSTATRPRSVDGSVIAPSLTWLRGASSDWKSFFRPTTSPGIPFSISVRATSTVTGSLSDVTLLRYWFKYRSSRNAANRAATPPSATVPPRVDNIFCTSCIAISLLIRQHGNAASEAVEVAHLAAAATVVESEHVLDEMTDDVPGVASRNRVVAVALTRVLEAAAARGPAGDVERPELDDGDGPASRAAE